MDELTKSLFRHILAGDGSDEAAVLLAVQMALVGRHYERIADHAVTIAERVGFMVTGEHPTLDPARRSAVFVVAEVPLEDEVLALGVARDPLAVAPELRVVRREELQPGDRPLAELVDHAAVAEDAVDLPVGRDRAEVDDLDVPLRRDLLERFGLHRHDGQRSGSPRSAGGARGRPSGRGRLAQRRLQRLRFPSRSTLISTLSPGL